MFGVCEVGCGQLVAEALQILVTSLAIYVSTRKRRSSGSGLAGCSRWRQAHKRRRGGSAGCGDRLRLKVITHKTWRVPLHVADPTRLVSHLCSHPTPLPGCDAD